MVQLVTTIQIPSGGQRILFERPHSLCRIFFSVRVVVEATMLPQSWVSFDDPKFLSHYSLDGATPYFEARGEGISQGDIWVRNWSAENRIYTATEILI